MKALAPKPLILHLSTRPLRLFHSAPAAATSTAGEDSHRRRSESSSVMRRNYDEENRNVKVTVWWDFENCGVPSGFNVERVASRIGYAIRSVGIKGPVTITAFGDVVQLSRATQEALTSTGVCLNHVPHRGKNSSDRSFLADLVYWVTQNPPPAHFFLITSDKDFANILHRLRMSNYNILLASKSDQATGVLCSAATVMWPWTELIKGENVSAKHFNHSPDGFYGSWYGQYKGVLDDPFQNVEHCAVAQPEEFMEQISDVKIRPIPRVIVNGIRNVLHSYPEGMSLSELRCELRRKSIGLDKDLYGHKKFSSLLASLSSIVKLIPNPSGDGQPIVVDKRLVDSVEPNSKPSKVEPVELKSKSEKEAEMNMVEKNQTVPVATPVIKSEEIASNSMPPQMPVHKSTVAPTQTLAHQIASIPTQIPIDNVVAEGGTTKVKQGEHNELKEGFFKRTWAALTSGGSKNNDIISQVDYSSSEEAIKTDALNDIKAEEKAAPLKESSIPVSESVGEEKLTEQSEKQSEVSSNKVGFFSRLVKWWQYIMFGADSQEDISVEKHLETDVKEEQVEQSPALFSKPDFWDAIESFLLTSKGTNLIFMSSSRDQLMQKLRNEGPSVLKDLNENHLLKLVDKLITEKKWVDESAAQTFPFKVTAKKRMMSSQNAHASNGLSSLFKDKASNETSELKAPQNFTEFKSWYQKYFNNLEDIRAETLYKTFETDFNKKLSSSSYGYPTIRSLIFACSVDNNNNYQGTKKNYKAPNKGEVLNDCHKLVMELLKENPDGFNMSNFRPAFFNKYGYILDCQMLGYPKLASLLQIMPGVKIESSFVMPEHLGNGEDWEELGPVPNTCQTTDKKSKEMGYSKVSLSDEEFSDSDDEVSPSNCDGSKSQPRRGEEDSSLMQILDSWYINKENGGDKNRERGTDGLVDCSRSNSKNEMEYSKFGVKPHKRYSFVAGPADDEKDQLVDNILGSLKKAGVGESKLQG